MVTDFKLHNVQNFLVASRNGNPENIIWKFEGYQGFVELTLLGTPRILDSETALSFVIEKCQFVLEVEVVRP